MTKGFFITGTDTGVGKTYVTALIIKAFQEIGANPGYFKAALSGAEGEVSDVDYIINTCGLKETREQCVPFIYKTPVSPHLAGAIENRPFDPEVAAATYNNLSRRHNVIIAEGSGGIACPLHRTDQGLYMLTDIIKLTGLPLIIVVPCRVGAINAGVTTAAYGQNLGLNIAGLILNHYDETNITHKDNATTLKTLTNLPIIAKIPPNATSINLNI